MLAASWVRAVVALAIVEVVIDVAVEVVGTMEPGAGADEYAAREPLGTVVAVGSAVVRGNFIVAIRAIRGRTDFNRDLRRGMTTGGQKKAGAGNQKA